MILNNYERYVNIKNLHKSISLILSVILLITFSVVSFADIQNENDLNYDEFFSEERLFKDLSLYETDDYVIGIDDMKRIYKYSNRTKFQKRCCYRYYL